MYSEGIRLDEMTKYVERFLKHVRERCDIMSSHQKLVVVAQP